MDLIKILRDRINALDVGDHTPGLRAVLQHVEVAANHLTRGSSTGDDTAFTDAIYRTNQAFEGSLKEAYRTLASADPSHKSPFEIENYFQGRSTFRPRVLDQFSTYRKEWRNPSTHDYKLDFDEDEALLAIVSVCAFAIVLIDQIASKLSYDKAAAAAPPPAVNQESKPLPDSVVQALLTFRVAPSSGPQNPMIYESEVVGAIAGHLSKTLPDLEIAQEPTLSASGRERVDLLIKRRDQRLLLEVKRAARIFTARSPAIAQVSHYIAVSGIKDAILYYYDDAGEPSTEQVEYELPGVQSKILILRPPNRTKTA